MAGSHETLAYRPLLLCVSSSLRLPLPLSLSLSLSLSARAAHLPSSLHGTLATIIICAVSYEFEGPKS